MSEKIVRIVDRAALMAMSAMGQKQSSTKVRIAPGAALATDMGRYAETAELRLR
jgi:hypothetical protein